MASPSRRLQTKPVITCLKSVLLTYTFVSGIVLLAVGVWGRVSLAVYFSLLDEKATNVPFVLVGAGVVVVLLGTFGCFATCRGSTWMLKLYAMLLSLIFLIVLVAAVVGFVFRHEVSRGWPVSSERFHAVEQPASRGSWHRVGPCYYTRHPCHRRDTSLPFIRAFNYLGSWGMSTGCGQSHSCRRREVTNVGPWRCGAVALGAAVPKAPKHTSTQEGDSAAALCSSCGC
uniref:Tetraspanin n=1 Tax=Anas zonorhyncha TaxID=75864 RepID=A0A8B9ZUQ6_9AVES